MINETFRSAKKKESYAEHEKQEKKKEKTKEQKPEKEDKQISNKYLQMIRVLTVFYQYCVYDHIQVNIAKEISSWTKSGCMTIIHHVTTKFHSKIK